MTATWWIRGARAAGVSAGLCFAILGIASCKSKSTGPKPVESVASVVISPLTDTIDVGDSVQLSATTKDSAGDVLTGHTITWTSRETFIATVDTTGLVEGVEAGTAQIVATSGSVSDTATITIAPAPLVFAQISASSGENEACGLTTSGVAYCWGMGDVGELGVGSFPYNTLFPHAVSTTLRFSSISVGGRYVCAVTTGHAGYCWGVAGRLGDNNTSTSSDTAVAIYGGYTFDSISAGNSHACGLTSSSTLYCWGDHSVGETGDNTTQPPYVLDSVPVAVYGTNTYTSVSAHADWHSCAIVTGGGVVCWGDNSQYGPGQLGTNAVTEDSVPIAIMAPGSTLFSAVSVGGDHSCAISTGGLTYCWGDGNFGDLGDGLTTYSYTPVVVSGSNTFVAISAGAASTCALTSSGAAYCWGDNTYGELGNGTNTGSSTPVAVSGGLTFAKISAGADFVCGITTAGQAYCWGDNSEGGLGINSSSITSSNVPVPVTDANGQLLASVTPAKVHPIRAQSTTLRLPARH